MRFLDTNVFIRYLTGDDPAKQETCARLFQSLDRGEEEATATEAVLAEVLFVLISPRWYRLERDEAASRLRPLLLASGLRIPEKARLMRALDLFALYRFLDFEDALTAAYVEGTSHSVVSYDRDFDRVPGVVRIEP